MTTRRDSLRLLGAFTLMAAGLAGLEDAEAASKKPRASKRTPVRKAAPKPVPASLPGSSALVVHMNSGSALIKDREDTQLKPASLTKMMTAALWFDALDEGRVKMTDMLRFSTRAAASENFKLGFAAGTEITGEQAVESLICFSANDVAVLIAEHLAGTEEAFAVQMTNKARALGMSQTMFKNASGMPHAQQVTTAADMAKLAAYLIKDKQKYYDYFRTEEVTIHGRTFRDRLSSAQALIPQIKGLDGLKSGWIRSSGSCVVTSIKRGEDRLIVVVMGGASWDARNKRVARLTEEGFEIVERRKLENRVPRPVDSPSLGTDNDSPTASIVKPAPLSLRP